MHEEPNERRQRFLAELAETETAYLAVVSKWVADADRPLSTRLQVEAFLETARRRLRELKERAALGEGGWDG